MATSTRTTIRNGSTGSDVKTLQMMLNEVYGSRLAVDSVFGNKTEGLVKHRTYATGTLRTDKSAQAIANYQ